MMNLILILRIARVNQIICKHMGRILIYTSIVFFLLFLFMEIILSVKIKNDPFIDISFIEWELEQLEKVKEKREKMM